MRRMSIICVVAACSSSPATVTEVSHEFPSITLAPGQEITNLCQSWTLHNDQPIYVTGVTMQNTAGWHHSNWVFAPDTQFPGDDGMWDCSERSFDARAAAIQGGVLYAQSTQATSETQEFVPGAAIMIPPHSMIIGETHALNTSDNPVDTAISLDIHATSRAHVQTLLRGMSFEYHPLEIAPMARSRFTMQCDLASASEGVLGPLAMHLHYVMPHYHKLGVEMKITAFGGAQDGAVVFDTMGRTGDAVGSVLDPPYDLTGATGVSVSCTFDNPRTDSVGWGVGDQEMCVFLAFTDSPLLWGGGAIDDHGNVFDGTDADGTRENHSACTVLAVQPQD